MIDREDVRRILATHGLVASVAEDADYQAEIVIDSLSLVWLLHALEQEHDIKLAPEGEDFAEFTSIDRIWRYIERKTSG